MQKSSSVIPKVSVVVPVYKAEHTIARCACSLFEQTLDDIEYIFIDDCTPDASMAALKSVVENHPTRKNRVHVFRMPMNSGVAEVRKFGINMATGKFIIHCDSDDWVEPTMIQCMYEKAVSEGLDIVACDFMEEIGETKIVRKGKSTQDSDLVSDCLLIHGSLCNKLVSHHIAQNGVIIWPTGNCAEDLALSVQYSLMAARVGYIERPLYHYVRSDNSILGARSDESILRRQIEIQSNYKVLKESLLNHHVEEKYSQEMIHEGLFIKNLSLPLLKKRSISLSDWRAVCADVNSKVLSCSLISIREKLNFIVSYIGLYPLFCKLFR